jgi:hypothetical protein
MCLGLIDTTVNIFLNVSDWVMKRLHNFPLGRWLELFSSQTYFHLAVLPIMLRLTLSVTLLWVLAGTPNSVPLADTPDNLAAWKTLSSFGDSWNFHCRFVACFHLITCEPMGIPNYQCAFQ